MASERSGSSKGGSGSSGKGRDSSDPDVLVAEIERTREDLAETLDQIADRVSPKRVAQRSSKRIAETVKEKAAVAKVVLSEKAVLAKEVVGEKAASARESAVTAKGAVSERLSGSPAGRAEAELPPVAGVEVPELAPHSAGPIIATTPTGGAHASPSSLLSDVPKEVLVGAAAALLGLWLLWRRRQ